MTPEARASLCAKMPAVMTVEGRTLSTFNTILIAWQRPGCTVVGGFRQWLAHGRCVQKGERGVQIWIPCGAKSADGTEGSDDAARAEGEAERSRFISGTIFDVTQTAPVVAGDSPGKIIDVDAKPTEIRGELPAPAEENKPADDGEAPAGEIPSPSDEAPGPDFPDRQVALYNAAVDEMQRNYQALSKMNVSLLKEFGVWPAEVLKRLKEKSTKLRDIYWSHLFGKLSAVTNRLTKKKRDALLRTLNRNGHVDFTVGNIHAVLIYVLKNANQFLDEQLIEVTERMIEKANVRNYKSNDRVFVHDRWRYAEEKPTHIALEYRIVLGWCGGIRRGYSFEKGLDDTAREFIGDLMTVARNLGFDCDTQHPELNEPLCREWESGDKKVIMCKYAGKTEPLLEVRAFLNRNLHIRMNQRFALALNVEFGRLKGWLRSGREAAEEVVGYFEKTAQCA